MKIFECSAHFPGKVDAIQNKNTIHDVKINASYTYWIVSGYDTNNGKNNSENLKMLNIPGILF